MSPRPDVSEERKQQIIEAAISVFARNGLHKTRMDDIAAESKTSKGLLYWYFKSKDEIVIAILDTLFGSEYRNFENLANLEGTAHDRLRRFIDQFVTDLKAMERIRPILYEIYSLAMRDPTLQKYTTRVLKSYLDMAVPLFRQGIEKGEFRPIDPEEAALAIGAIFEGTALMWMFDPKRVNLEKQVETGVDLFMRGLER